MQHLHDRQTGIQTDEIGQFQRPHRMVRAEFHRRVDRLDVPDALIEGVDRLVDHRLQDAVDDEGRKILRYRDLLAELADKFLGGVEGGIVGGDAADQLDQLHQRHRIHEMNADEFFRAIGRGGEPRDRDRRGVGGDDRSRLQRCAELMKYLALDLFLFDRGLDHEIAVRQPVERLAGGDPVERLLARVLGNGLLGDLPRQMAVDGRHRRFQPLGGDVVEHHVEAGERRHMRNAIAHLARADHTDLLDCHRHLVIHRNGAHIAPVHLRTSDTI